MSLFATISGFNLGYFVVVESSRWRQETSLRFLLLTGVLQAETFFWPNRTLGNTGGVRKRKKKEYIPCNQAGLLYDIFRQHGLDSLRFCSIIGCASSYSRQKQKRQGWLQLCGFEPNLRLDGVWNQLWIESFHSWVAQVSVRMNWDVCGCSTLSADEPTLTPRSNAEKANVRLQLVAES